MKITFMGATKGVTGSCHMVEACGKTFLLDCGLFQGTLEEQVENYEDFSFDISSIDFVILSHAHIDHSGRIPRLYKLGYRGPVYSTVATADLCTVMLPDSGHIQEKDNEWINRKRRRAGRELVNPIYTVDDAINSCKLFKSLQYGQMVEISENLKFRLVDAGHMLGSSLIEIWITENGKTEKIVYTGDIGNSENPIICDPCPIEEVDYLIMESTYGNRNHPPLEEQSEEFVKIILDTIHNGGNVVIPSFAVGRTQELLYRLNQYVDKENLTGNYIEELSKVPVVVDSPLARNATEIFKDNFECYNEEALAYLLGGDNPIDFKSLKFTSTADESQALNEDLTPKIIISASGMCEAGRIKHHLKHNLWRPESTILFVGYQAEGTLGRRLMDGVKTVKIFGEEITVRASIKWLNAFSGHADQSQLLSWVKQIKEKPKKIFLVHGELDAKTSFKELLETECGENVEIPYTDELYTFGEDITIDKNELKNNISLKLRLFEEVVFLKQDVDTYVSNIKHDIRSDISKEELDSIMEDITKLKEYLGNLRAKL